ncbi:MAG: benzoate-CoA ligase family protein [Fuerstiella sp.]|nr:benzoate-CoA ligase family protein [Fuerstiella sp.]
MEMNAASVLVDANVEAGRGENTAICDLGQDRTYTYREVMEMTNRAGNALKELGVRMEDRVLLLLFDSSEFVFSFFGAIKIGAVPIPTNTQLKAEEYEYLLNDCRARVLVVNEALLEKIEPIRHKLRYLRHIVVVGEPHNEQLSFAELVDAASSELTAEMMSPDDACFWLYSSGTTGFPKGAVHLQHDMIVAADLYARPTLGITENDRTFSVAKLFFAYGLGNGLYFPFRVGAATILYPDRPEPLKVYEAIQEHRPSIFFGVPTSYAKMLAVEGAEDQFDTSSIRLCVSAGEALPPALFERWQTRFGVEILDGIGSTEILHIFISNKAGRVKPGSTGEVVPGYEAKIVDEEGRDLPPGEIGDLLIKGDSTMAFYWNKHEQTKAALLGDWIRTGDKYSVDEDDYFWYQGRTDDMLKVSGMWLSPLEVENVLVEHSAVLESAVIGMANPDGLIKPKAFVVLKNGQGGFDSLRDELQDLVKAKIGAHKRPHWIEFIADLPKTATGKTQRYKLRELA